MKKERLDIIVSRSGLVSSRERARNEIISCNVLVNGQMKDKPGLMVSEDAIVTLKNQAMPFVSRGGVKLQKALEVFRVDPTGCICIDCGASSGGFTDCLLQHGASKVYAVDAGYEQLAPSLRKDARVISLERTNVRHLTKELIPEEAELVVADLSFISLKLILPSVYEFLCDRGEAICLVKPQFEAGRQKVGKKGVVRDERIHREVLESFASYAEDAGFHFLGLDYSPVKGPEGNIEYLAHLSCHTHVETVVDIGSVVRESHRILNSLT